MTTRQRMENDIETMDKREAADRTKMQNRNRNDEITEEKREVADKTLEENRNRNDEITARRREKKDEDTGMALAIPLLILLILGIGGYIIFI